MEESRAQLKKQMQRVRMAAGLARGESNADVLQLKKRRDGLDREICRVRLRISDPEKYARQISAKNVRERSIHPTRKIDPGWQDRRRDRSARYYEKIKDDPKFKQYMRDYQRIHRRARWHSDPAFKLASGIRTRMYLALKRTNAKKSAHTIDLVGCTIAELVLHLERKFTTGMSWDNYGD